MLVLYLNCCERNRIGQGMQTNTCKVLKTAMHNPLGVPAASSKAVDSEGFLFSSGSGEPAADVVNADDLHRFGPLLGDGSRK